MILDPEDQSVNVKVFDLAPPYSPVEDKDTNNKRFTVASSQWFRGHIEPSQIALDSKTT